LNDSERAEHLKRYLNRAAKMAKERRIERILILPLYLRPYRTALAAAQQGISTKLELLALSGDPSEINSTLSARDSCGTRYALVLDPSVETLADVASGVIPIIPLATAKLASVSMNSLPKHATAGPSGGVFGRMPAMRAVPMPDPAKRQGYCDLVPALNGAYRNRSQPSEQSYEWLDLRPEVPITPILKSLVLAGMETIPAAMGFTDLEPMYVTWMRCRFHFRKDTFIALWMRLQQAAWDESFMTVMLERVHQTYARLGRAANVFPMTETDWQKASSAQLREWFIPWWHAFVDFFSQSFFIQALGDDGMFPYVAKTVAANLEKAKAAGLDALGTWPGVAELTAPTTPVLTAEYLADLARLKQALTEAGRTALESAMDAVSEGPKRNPKVIAALNEHLSRWHWMRERDPYYEPYDQPRVVLEKALATREAPAPDYAGNARSNLLALSLHFDLTHGISDPKKWVHAVRYGQALSADRENHHVVWLKCSYPFRKLCLEWERRLKERVQGSGFRVQEIKEPMRAKDIFFMEVPEILEAIEALPNPLNADFLAKVHNRRAAYHRELKLKIAGEPTPEPVEERDYY